MLKEQTTVPDICDEIEERWRAVYAEMRREPACRGGFREMLLEIEAGARAKTIEELQPDLGILIRRSRTAKASRISRHAVKSRCACERGGWGRLSDDGPGQNNPDPGVISPKDFLAKGFSGLGVNRV